MAKLGIHQKLNRLPVKYKSESLLNCFYSILEAFNNQYMAEEITLTRKELFNLANLGARYDSSKIKIFLSEFCKSDTYSVQDTILHGSIFTAKENPDDTVTIYISKPFKPYIFFKEDIEIMKKVKEKKELKEEEVEYKEKVLKEKKNFLMLLEKTEILGIKGKYAKRLLALLMQFQKTGYFVMQIEQFKELMEVPKSYTLGQLNAEVIKKAKKELSKNLFEFYEQKQGKGRRVIEKIEISFKYLGSLKLEEVIKEKNIDVEEAEIIPEKKSKVKKVSRLDQMKEEAYLSGKIIMNYADFVKEIKKCRSQVAVKKVCEKYNLVIFK